MTLAPGTRLGPYEIAAPLGAGGMGEVFRARDTKLDREVAIKVLPAEVAQDRERLARFEREAKLLASLNHSNIAHVYGFESATLPDGSTAHFLAMELVGGEDLAERLKRGALPVDEALPLAVQIAEGLEEAHEHGIIHRDLKPANILVTPDGKVKILDFGLAKALEGDPSSSAAHSQLSHSPTLSRHMTEAGMIMGTAAYMSPEQARGKAVDRRADIWAFGVVAFEMLTGERLFKGDTVSDTLAAVLREEIPWDRLPKATPPALARTLHRCLNRDPKRRLHSAADVRNEIEEAITTPREDPTHSSTEKPAGVSSLPWVVAALLALVLAGVMGRGLTSSNLPLLTRVKVELSPGEPLGNALGANSVLSPDGRTIAFVSEAHGARSHISVRRLDQLEATSLAGTDDAHGPFFSPDGRWIGFETPNRLMKVGLSGGAPIVLADVGSNPGRGATWSGDEIVFARVNTGLFRVSDAGGDARPLTTLDEGRSERTHRWPSFLPGGKAVLFMVQHLGQDYDDGDIEAVSLADGRRTILVRGGSFPRYAPGGYLTFVRDHVLYAVRLDPDSLEVEEPATAVLAGLKGHTGDEASGDGSAEVALSAQGDLLYRPSGGGDPSKGTQFEWIDAAGQATPAFHESLYVVSFGVSPDGRRIAYDGRSPRGPGLFIKDLDRGTVTPLTTDGGGESNPAWSPDGKRLAYKPRRTTTSLIRVRTMDRPDAELDIPVDNPSGAGPTAWLPDSSGIVAGVFLPATLNDIALFSLGPEKPRPLVDLPGVDEWGDVSPDGRWLAFASDEKGAFQIFVTSLLASGPRFQVSVQGGGQPRWSRDGRLLYFVEAATPDQPGRLVAVPFSLDGDRPRFGATRQASPLLHGMPRRDYDVLSDGRILAINRVYAEFPDSDSAHAILVLGWREELARLMNDTR